MSTRKLRLKKAKGKLYTCVGGPYNKLKLYLTRDSTLPISVGGKVGMYIVIAYNRTAKWVEQELV